MHTRVKLLGGGGADEDHTQIIGGDTVKLLGEYIPPSPRVSAPLCILSKLRNILLFTVFRKLYYSMVHSHLLYGIVIWGNAYENHLKRLIILQNEAVKIVSSEQRQDHVTPFYQRLQILKPKNLYVYEVAKLIHKNSRKKLPNRLNCHFSPLRAIHTRTTSLA